MKSFEFTIPEQLILSRALSVYSDFVKYDHNYRLSVDELQKKITAPQVSHNLNVDSKVKD